MVEDASGKGKSPNLVRAEIQTTMFLLLDIACSESTHRELGIKAADAATALRRILALMLKLELEDWWNEELAKREASVDAVFFEEG